MYKRQPLSESNRLAKLVPDKIPDMKKFKLGDAIKYVPELKEAANGNDPLARDTLKYAQMLEGNVRNTGVHACGVIIGRYDISDVVPVSTAKDKDTGEEMLVTPVSYTHLDVYKRQVLISSVYNRLRILIQN